MDFGALDLPLNQGGEVVHIVGRHVCAVASLTLCLAGWFVLSSSCGTRIPRQWWKGGSRNKAQSDISNDYSSWMDDGRIPGSSAIWSKLEKVVYK